MAQPIKGSHLVPFLITLQASRVPHIPRALLPPHPFRSQNRDTCYTAEGCTQSLFLGSKFWDSVAIASNLTLRWWNPASCACAVARLCSGASMARHAGAWNRELTAVAFLAALLLTWAPHLSFAADEDPLQDFCVAQAGAPTVNGLVCKPADQVAAKDFKFSGLNTPGNTANKFKAAVTAATVVQFPGLNTLGISAARVDFAVGGLNPPHSHPRATELLFVVEGTLKVGFVSSNGNTLFQQTLNKGDLFVFPRGLIHFQKNIGDDTALAIAALSSQNPGVQQTAAALFGSPLPSDVLQQTLGVNAKTVQLLEAKQK